MSAPAGAGVVAMTCAGCPLHGQPALRGNAHDLFGGAQLDVGDGGARGKQCREDDDCAAPQR